MAIYSLSIKPISRSSGKSVIAAIAYRSGELIEDIRTGIKHNYSNRKDILHKKILLPEEAKSSLFALDRSILWNTVEAREKRRDARLAKEIMVALPCELDLKEQIELAEEFCKGIVKKYGVAADLAIHEANKHGDDRNVHAHVLLTTRILTKEGLGDKSDLERENAYLQKNGKETSHQQIRNIRKNWAELANIHLEKAGIEQVISEKSYKDRGIGIVPGIKLGRAVIEQFRKGFSGEKIVKYLSDKVVNSVINERNSEEILKLISAEKSTFSDRDIDTYIRRVSGGIGDTEKIKEKILSRKDVVRISSTKKDIYTTKEMLNIENRMLGAAQKLKESKIRPSKSRNITRVLEESFLSDEQKKSVEAIVSGERLTIVEGVAGSGKSTMLKAANEILGKRGRVFGGSLTGKSVEELKKSSGIEGKTLQYWMTGWEAKNEKLQLKKGDVFILDEAGMVGSKQMFKLLDHIARSGAKAVLVGDSRQLQPIAAGGAFRALSKKLGSENIIEVRRQKLDWQKEASKELGRGETSSALKRYLERPGCINFGSSHEASKKELVNEYVGVVNQDRQHMNKIVLAHTKKDAADLNDQIRKGLKERKILYDEKQLKTASGTKDFAINDKIVFLKNDEKLGVKNGTLGSISKLGWLGKIKVQMQSEDGVGKTIKFNTRDYNNFDYGHALTLHKSQGATVDKSYILASKTMDSHLTYVGLTRHRESVKMYVGEKENILWRLSRERPKETTIEVISKEKDPKIRYAHEAALKHIDFEETFRKMKKYSKEEKEEITKSFVKEFMSTTDKNLHKKSIGVQRCFKEYKKVLEENRDIKGLSHER